MKSEYLSEISEFDKNRVKERKRREQLERDAENLFQAFSPKIERESRKVEFLVEGFLPKGSLVILAGRPKEGKTCLGTAIALAVATGRPFAGMNTEMAPVLWMANEESKGERAAILGQFTSDGGPYPVITGEHYDWMDSKGPFLPLFTSHERVPIDTDDGLYTIDLWLGKTGAKLIVIDPLIAAVSGPLEHSGSARRSLEKLKEFCWHRGVTALVLHHTKRVRDSRYFRRVADSDQLAATASMDMVLVRDPSSGLNGRPYLFTLSCRGRGEFANKVWLLESSRILDYQIRTEQPTLAAAEPSRVGQAILRALEGGELTIRELCRQIQGVAPCRENWVWVNVTRLMEDGKVVVSRREGVKRWYALP